VKEYVCDPAAGAAGIVINPLKKISANSTDD